MARIDINNLAVFKTILAETLHLFVAIESDRDYFAVRFLRVQEGLLLRGAGYIIITVALQIDAGRGGRRPEQALNLGFLHPFANLVKGAGLGEIAAVVNRG